MALYFVPLVLFVDNLLGRFIIRNHLDLATYWDMDEKTLQQRLLALRALQHHHAERCTVILRAKLRHLYQQLTPPYIRHITHITLHTVKTICRFRKFTAKLPKRCKQHR
jgi:hypothetical protein